MELFASNLRKRAIELGIANAEAARRAGLSERRYGHYVNGIREPDLATLVRIAEALQTRLDNLLGFGAKDDHSARGRLTARLASATQVLTEDLVELVVVQVEALVANQREQSAKNK